MRKISSSSTWWNKKAFPAIWFGFIGIFTLAWIPAVIQGQVPAPTILIPIVMAVYGFFLIRWLVFPLVDELWIENDEIVVRNRGDEDRFPITNIINVEASSMMNPERITLMLKEPCKFGRDVIFSPPVQLWPFGRHPLAEYLIRRVHQLDAGDPDSRRDF